MADELVVVGVGNCSWSIDMIRVRVAVLDRGGLRVAAGSRSLGRGLFCRMPMGHLELARLGEREYAL